jgi:hypothetical protein
VPFTFLLAPGRSEFVSVRGLAWQLWPWGKFDKNQTWAVRLWLVCRIFPTPPHPPHPWLRCMIGVAGVPAPCFKNMGSKVYLMNCFRNVPHGAEEFGFG